MGKSAFIHSSVGRKILMAGTGFFLMVFLLVHLSVNLFLFFGEEAFNQAAHFMATNPVIQVSQYILAAGFITHIFLGIKLHLENRAARGGVSYTINKWSAHTPFNARTMIYTGILVFCFLILHLKNFMLPMKTGKTQGMSDHQLVTTLFKNPVYTTVYVSAFIVLAIHLSHGFQSAFQSMGARHKRYTLWIKKLGVIYFWLISLGFSSIALWFFLK
ncbi:MAG: succinate dehydrogenase cytochrome b subunit [Flavobacteriales bacterium AspAUS03]